MVRQKKFGDSKAVRVKPPFGGDIAAIQSLKSERRKIENATDLPFTLLL